MSNKIFEFSRERHQSVFGLVFHGFPATKCSWLTNPSVTTKQPVTNLPCLWPAGFQAAAVSRRVSDPNVEGNSRGKEPRRCTLKDSKTWKAMRGRMTDLSSQWCSSGLRSSRHYVFVSPLEHEESQTQKMNFWRVDILGSSRKLRSELRHRLVDLHGHNTERLESSMFSYPVLYNGGSQT